MSKRSSRCPVCTGDVALVTEVNNLIASGVRLTKIHEAHPDLCSYSALSRHRNRCLAPSILPLDAGADDLNIWRQRCADAYHIAVANGDSRSAIAACSAATRQLVALSKRQEKAAEAEKTVADNRYSIEALDRQLEEFEQRRDAEDKYPRTKAACLCEEESRFCELVQLIWSDRRLLETLLIHGKRGATHTADGFIPREVQNASAND
jgi:hypothetical protein